MMFVVAPEVPAWAPRPVIAVDGPVRGADLTFDHHATGAVVNLDVIPPELPTPGTIATTMVDTDAVLSAAVVLLRAAGEHAAVEAVWPVLSEAAHLCDHLLPSGRHPEAEEAGLGLHLWLKERGLALTEVLSWAAGEVVLNGEPRPVPSPETRGRIFREETLAMVTAIRQGRLPQDTSYLGRLKEMAAAAQAAIVHRDGVITVIDTPRYLDPLAVYRVVQTPVVILTRPLPGGARSYSLGVHPKAYGQVDLRPVFARLAAVEPGWGGRATVGGSPVKGGSRLEIPQVVALVGEALRGNRQDVRTT